jgi:cell division septal protein FtsQ
MEYLQSLWSHLLSIQIVDALDIIIVAFLIYKIIPVFKATNTARIAKVVVIILAIAWLTGVVKLHTLNFVLNQFLSIGLLALVILFQPELRRMLDHLSGVKLKKFLGSGATKKFLLIVAILTAVGAILYSALFQVRRIVVLGNTTIPGQDIVRLTGLKIGQNSLTIDDENVMRRIESNRYLRCTLVDVQWDSVTIHIKERVPAVYLHYNGLLIVMDNRGFVLEESLASETGYESLVKVSGMNVRRCALGQQIALQSANQLEAYTQILVELKAMKGIDLLRELDMSSMDSIYLTTRDDFFVRLGSEDDLHAKLRAFLITREKVLQMGYAKGTIDVTDPGRPTYLP